MAKACRIVLDNDICNPGQTPPQKLTGRVQFNFTSNTTVKGVVVRFRGEGHAQIGKRFMKESLLYVEQYLMQDEGDGTQFPPGKHEYSFSFDVPTDLTTTFKIPYLYILYWIKAKVVVSWGIDLNDKQAVSVSPYLDLNVLPETVFNPVLATVVKKTIWGCLPLGGVTFEMALPIGGYVPSQVIKFTARLENLSQMNISKITVKLVQVLKSIVSSETSTKRKTIKKTEIADGSVGAGYEKTWNVEFKIPADAPVINPGSAIKFTTHYELLGQARLPFPHGCVEIRLPFVLGTEPLHGTIPNLP